MKSLLNRWDYKEEADIWKKAIFVFDSSVLLNFYEFSEKSRQDIYKNIFLKLKERLWITNQTEFEFLKHRERVTNRTTELYNEVKEKHFPGKHLKVFTQQFDQLKTRTGKDTRHPYILPDIFKKFEEVVAELVKLNEVLEQDLTKQIAQRLDEHNKEIEKDKLLNFFQITPGYKYDKLMEIVQEGEFRYRNKIPPGYADEKTKDVGIAKYGDLVIWKQIIELAGLKKQPVLLVIDDLKEDWFLTDNKDKNKLLSPRDELIKEMQDIGGVQFWAYSTSQFLYKANENLKSEISKEAIKEVKDVTTSRIKFAEKAVFDWATRRFNADETVWAADFWKKDTGADIIQVVDGVTFSIQIKYFSGRMRMKDLNEEIEQIKSIKTGEFTFESNTVVLVTDDRETAETLPRFMTQYLPGFEVFAGYLNENDEFVETARA